MNFYLYFLCKRIYLLFYILLFAHYFLTLSHAHTRDFRISTPSHTFVVAAAALRAHCALAATTTTTTAAAGSRILQIVAAAFGHFKSENVLLADRKRGRQTARYRCSNWTESSTAPQATISMGAAAEQSSGRAASECWVHIVCAWE